MNNYFCFKHNVYGKGTIVQMHEEYKEKFGFCSYLVFEEYDVENDLYRFRTLHDRWTSFNIYKNHLEEYIKEIVEAQIITEETPFTYKVDPNYVDGIASAWIWYIIVMFFGLFLQGTASVITVWVLASIIFFSWRRKKMNGG